MQLWSAGQRALLAQDPLGLYHGGHEIVCPLLSSGRERRSPREPFTRVGVVRNSAPFPPGPHEHLEEALVRPVGLPRRPKQFIFAGGPERVHHKLPGVGVLSAEADSPAAAQYFYRVGRVISHEVKVVRRLQPLPDGCGLPPVDPGVQVPGHKHVHARVDGWEKSPVHREYVADIGLAGQILHVADVEVGVGAGKAAEVLVEGGAGLQVVVHSYYPARVELGHQLQVFLDALNIFQVYRFNFFLL